MAQATLSFPSLDGLTLTADLYLVNENKNTPLIVLFHQAGWSRGEYHEIAPKLNDLGFNALAIDQRSGDTVNGVNNASEELASEKGKGTTFVDAMQDLEASLNYARTNYASGKLIAWGSSYSAALTLKLGGDKPELADALLAFSPGEYFVRFGQPSDWIQQSTGNIQAPTFVTSAKNEQSDWQNMYDAISTEKVFYLPETTGKHGSSALWESQSDNAGYWEAAIAFLESVKD